MVHRDATHEGLSLTYTLPSHAVVMALYAACLCCLCCLCAANPQSFGEELVAALVCQPRHGAAAAPNSPIKMTPIIPQPPNTLPAANGVIKGSQRDLWPPAGRAALALSCLLQDNAMGQMQALALQVPASDAGQPAAVPGSATIAAEPLLQRVVKLLQEAAHSSDPRGLQLCCSVLRLLCSWCAGCAAAVSAVLSSTNTKSLLVDMASSRVASGNVHTAGQQLLWLITQQQLL